MATNECESNDTFRLRTAGVSLLAPDFEIQDSDGNVVFQHHATAPMHQEISFTDYFPDNGQFIVQIASSADDVFAIGGYSLIMTFDDLLRVDESTINEFSQTRICRPDSDTTHELLSHESG